MQEASRIFPDYSQIRRWLETQIPHHRAFEAKPNQSIQRLSLDIDEPAGGQRKVIVEIAPQHLVGSKDTLIVLTIRQQQ
jgi:hypothetical protein